MKAALRLEKPDDMQATITVTMPLKEWKMLREKLTQPQGRIGYIPERFASLIGKAIDDASRTFESTLTVSTLVDADEDIDRVGVIVRTEGGDQ